MTFNTPVRMIVAAVAAAAFAGAANAQQSDPDALRRQIDSLQRQIDDLKASMERMKEAPPAAAPHAAIPTRSGLPSTVIRDNYVELYGHLDLSLDDATKGIDGKSFPAGTPAVGKLGWEPSLSSNLSRIGVRGAHRLGDSGLRGVFQVETQIDVAATPGTSSGDSVKGAWASRNSYLGLEGAFGAVKAGKTDAPYKLSTARMDPFSATVGDYNSVIGNTGGDNRAEFDTRLSHALWYESPHWGGLRFSALWSPSMNRSTDNSIPAEGEPNCTGGNAPPCNDGSFGTAYSAAVVWEGGPVYVTAAYEVHKDVNRQGDEAAGGGPAPLGAVDIADEKAAKLGIQYKLPFGMTISAIYERLKRDAPDPNFNERTHNATWLALTQKITPRDDINFGWARAGKTPGDPGVGPIDNRTNLYAFGYKHHFDRQTTVYVVYAEQRNHEGAHFDLGASGHGITTDCHDATGTCYFGGTVKAVSVGATYDF